MWTDKLGDAISLSSVETYPMEFHRNSADFYAVESAIAQGIDSHLEAIQFSQHIGEYGRVHLVLRPQSVRVLVRRLMESDSDDAQSLAGGICETLDIELI